MNSMSGRSVHERPSKATLMPRAVIAEIVRSRINSPPPNCEKRWRTKTIRRLSPNWTGSRGCGMFAALILVGISERSCRVFP